MSAVTLERDRGSRWRSLPFRAVVTAVLLASVATASAETRDLTPAERALVDRFSSVVGGLLDLFRSDDWVEKIDYTLEDPSTAVKPQTPLQVGALERTYNARPGSRRWNALLAPHAQVVTGGEAAPQAMAQAGRAMQPLMHVHVSATFNTRFSALDLEHDPELKIEGVTRALRDPRPTRYAEPGVVLLFSDAAAGRWVRADGGLRFDFANAPGAVVIENVEIRISGAKDRVDELLRDIDWRRVDAALGR